MTLLDIRDLRVAFRLGRREGETQRVQAVGRGDAGVSFEVAENTTVALVGESGSGKSVTALAILSLLPANAERRGRISFLGRDLLGASRAELQALRGKDIACVFQDPMSSLNPVFDVGRQLAEPLMKHLGLGVGVDDVSWGTMLAEAQSELILGHWWQLGAATLFMAMFVTAFSLMTDALRDALDPKLRGLE